MLHINEIRPRFTTVVTTADFYDKDVLDGAIVVNKKGELKLHQTVIAVGSAVRDLKPGDKVMINPMNYAKRKYSKDSIQNDMDNNPVLEFNFNFIKLEEKPGKDRVCLLLQDRDIEFAFEGEERDDVIQPVLNPGIVMGMA